MLKHLPEKSWEGATEVINVVPLNLVDTPSADPPEHRRGMVADMDAVWTWTRLDMATAMAMDIDTTMDESLCLCGDIGTSC